MDAQAKPERPQGEGQEGPSSSLPLRQYRGEPAGFTTILAESECGRRLPGSHIFAGAKMDAQAKPERPQGEGSSWSGAARGKALLCQARTGRH